MVDKLETSGFIELPFLYPAISDPYSVPTRFYESLNVKNWMRQLCTFSQIRSNPVTYINTPNPTSMDPHAVFSKNNNFSCLAWWELPDNFRTNFSHMFRLNFTAIAIR